MIQHANGTLINVFAQYRKHHFCPNSLNWNMKFQVPSDSELIQIEYQHESHELVITLFQTSVTCFAFHVLIIKTKQMEFNLA